MNVSDKASEEDALLGENDSKWLTPKALKAATNDVVGKSVTKKAVWASHEMYVVENYINTYTIPNTVNKQKTTIILKNGTVLLVLLCSDTDMNVKSFYLKKPDLKCTYEDNDVADEETFVFSGTGSNASYWYDLNTVLIQVLNPNNGIICLKKIDVSDEGQLTISDCNNTLADHPLAVTSFTSVRNSGTPFECRYAYMTVRDSTTDSYGPYEHIACYDKVANSFEVKNVYSAYSTSYRYIQCLITTKDGFMIALTSNNTDQGSGKEFTKTNSKLFYMKRNPDNATMQKVDFTDNISAYTSNLSKFFDVLYYDPVHNRVLYYDTSSPIRHYQFDLDTLTHSEVARTSSSLGSDGVNDYVYMDGKYSSSPGSYFSLDSLTSTTELVPSRTTLYILTASLDYAGGPYSFSRIDIMTPSIAIKVNDYYVYVRKQGNTKTGELKDVFFKFKKVVIDAALDIL